MMGTKGKSSGIRYDTRERKKEKKGGEKKVVYLFGRRTQVPRSASGFISYDNDIQTENTGRD